MIASVLRLSREDCKALRVKDVYSIHKAVYSLFPQENGRHREFLYADKGGDFYERRILILSRENPINPEFGSIASKEIPEIFLQEKYYGFEVQVNPVKRENATGKIISVRGRENLLQWFASKAPSYGFEVYPESLTVQDTDVVTFEKKSQPVTLGKAVFIGKLKVIDRKLFISVFENGLGKGKAFGFGLLQIVPLLNASVDA